MRGFACGDTGEIAEAAEHAPDDEGADRQKRHELDERFGGDRQDQAVLMFGRIDPARAEGHRESGEQQRDGRGRKCDEGAAGARRACSNEPITIMIVCGDRLELQRDIRAPRRSPRCSATSAATFCDLP